MHKNSVSRAAECWGGPACDLQTCAAAFGQGAGWRDSAFLPCTDYKHQELLPTAHPLLTSESFKLLVHLLCLKPSSDFSPTRQTKGSCMIDDDSDLPLTPCSTWVLLLASHEALRSAASTIFEMPMPALWTADSPLPPILRSRILPRGLSWVMGKLSAQVCYIVTTL